MENPDKKPEQKDEQEHNFKFYLQPANFTKIISNKKSIYGSYALIGYIGHFLLIVIGINLFSDGDRMLPCGGAKMYGDPKS